MQTRPGVPAPISTQFAGLSLSGSPPHPSYLAQRLQLSLPVLGRKLEGVPGREERDNIRCWRDTDWHKAGLPPAMEKNSPIAVTHEAPIHTLSQGRAPFLLSKNTQLLLGKIVISVVS